MRCYIFDIDGTLADCGHRLHHIQKTPKDWPAFFMACTDDVPIQHVIDLANDLFASGCKIVYASGRSDMVRKETERWLQRHALPPGPVYMRAADDHRDDDILKAELLAALKADGYVPVMAFDDRNRVVATWRANGVPCAQVADGDF